MCIILIFEAYNSYIFVVSVSLNITWTDKVINFFSQIFMNFA